MHCTLTGTKMLCVNELSPSKALPDGLMYRGTVYDSSKKKHNIKELIPDNTIESCTGQSCLMFFDKVNRLHSMFVIYMKQ